VTLFNRCQLAFTVLQSQKLNYQRHVDMSLIILTFASLQN